VNYSCLIVCVCVCVYNSMFQNLTSSPRVCIYCPGGTIIEFRAFSNRNSIRTYIYIYTYLGLSAFVLIDTRRRRRRRRAQRYPLFGRQRCVCVCCVYECIMIYLSTARDDNYVVVEKTFQSVVRRTHTHIYTRTLYIGVQTFFFFFIASPR